MTTTVQSVTASPFGITLEVRFSDQMRMDNALSDSGNYRFDLGMYARLVEMDSRFVLADAYGLTTDRVWLWVELYQGTSPFTMTVSSDLRDADGYAIPLPRTFAVVPPYQSSADLSRTDGLIRTWRYNPLLPPPSIRPLVVRDEKRIYLASPGGIDVFANTGDISVASRWAQVLDEYGADALFVAHSPSAYVFSDTAAPYLTDQFPSPSGFAGPTDSILFSVRDATTAVEITSVAVYVDGYTAFSGTYGGWGNEFSGNIVVAHKRLDFTIVPRTPFVVGRTILVRVVATDLMSNVLTASYSFTVVAPGAYGLDWFGLGTGMSTSPFGGV